jgi:orotate phosphoribosyltransferase
MEAHHKSGKKARVFFNNQKVVGGRRTRATLVSVGKIWA